MAQLTTTQLFLSSASFSVITLLYLGAAWRRSGAPSSVPIEQMAVLMPILYGLAGVANRQVIRAVGTPNAALLTGAVFGLALSLVGRFYYELPERIFDNMSGAKASLTAIVLYAAVFRAMTALGLQ